MLRPILFLFLLIPLPMLAGEPPRVLVTIKPIHSLVSTLLTDIGQPELLLDGQLSPHQYALRPSDATRLAKADIIIWVGPTLESFMQKQLGKAANKIIIQLTASNNTASALDRIEIDPHRWLNPQLALHDVQYIADELIKHYPDHRATISSNLLHLSKRLNDLDNELKNLLPRKQTLSAVLYHDAWSYFMQHYQLSVHGIINPSAHQQPGARHLGEIMQTIETRKSRCLLTEPQFKPRYINTLKDKFQLKVFSVDPLGTDQAAGVDAYFNMMRTNANIFAQCQ